MKSVHTIFDYLSASAKNDHQVALVTANWTETAEGGRYCGGRPPSLEALFDGPSGSDKGQVNCFVKALFCKYQGVPGADNEEFQKLLTASILLRLPQFIEALKEHPSHDFGAVDESCYHKHHFLHSLLVAAYRANISDPISTLTHWADLICADFKRRNFGLLLPDKDSNHNGSCNPDEPDAFEGRTMTGICKSISSQLSTAIDEMRHHTTLKERKKNKLLNRELTYNVPPLQST